MERLTVPVQKTRQRRFLKLSLVRNLGLLCCKDVVLCSSWGTIATAQIKCLEITTQRKSSKKCCGQTCFYVRHHSLQSHYTVHSYISALKFCYFCWSKWYFWIVGLIHVCQLCLHHHNCVGQFEIHHQCCLTTTSMQILCHLSNLKPRICFAFILISNGSYALPLRWFHWLFLQMFLVFMMLVNVVYGVCWHSKFFDISYWSLFAKSNWFWCEKQPEITQTKMFYTHKIFLKSWRIFSNVVFRLCTFHVNEKSRVQYVVLPKAKHISLTNACCLKFVGFQFHRQELQKWVVVFGCKLCLVMFPYVYNCGWIVWNVSTVSLDSLQALNKNYHESVCRLVTHCVSFWLFLQHFGKFFRVGEDRSKLQIRLSTLSSCTTLFSAVIFLLMSFRLRLIGFQWIIIRVKELHGVTFMLRILLRFRTCTCTFQQLALTLAPTLLATCFYCQGCVNQSFWNTCAHWGST